MHSAARADDGIVRAMAAANTRTRRKLRSDGLDHSVIVLCAQRGLSLSKGHADGLRRYLMKSSADIRSHGFFLNRSSDLSENLQSIEEGGIKKGECRTFIAKN
jgi:hypothetical protein